MSDSKPPSLPSVRTTVPGTGWEKDVWGGTDAPDEQPPGAAAAEGGSRPAPPPPARALPPPPSRSVPVPSRVPLPPLPPLPPPPPAKAEQKVEPPKGEAGHAEASGLPVYPPGSAPEILEIEPVEPSAAPEVGPSDVPFSGVADGPPRQEEPAVTRQRPRWLIGACLGVGGLLVGVLTGIAVSASNGQSSTAPRSTPASRAESPAISAASVPAASASAEAPTPKEPTVSQADLERLESKPAHERTLSEVLSLARGRRAAHAEELEKLGEKLRGPGAEDPANWRTLREFVYDSATSVDALALAAALPAPAGPDFLHRTWSSSYRKTPVTELSDWLLSTKEVYGHASPALKLVLDLAQAKTCEENLALLDRAIESGDRRALPALGKLLNKRGCGDKGREDCFLCLRDGDKLKEALKAARSRPAPRLP
jgi:hypothetical protein